MSYVDDRLAEIERFTGRTPSSAVRRILEHAAECEVEGSDEKRVQALLASARLELQAFDLARKEAAALAARQSPVTASDRLTQQLSKVYK